MIENLIVIIFCLSLPFIIAAIVVKFIANDSVKLYLFDLTAVLAIALYLLIMFLVFSNSRVVSALAVGESFRFRSSGGSASSLFVVLPGLAASYLVFGRAFFSEYSVKNIHLKFWRFLAWCFLIIMASGLTYSLSTNLIIYFKN